MNSRKKLKKDINKSFNTLYRDIAFYEAFSINADSAGARAILAKTLATEEELLKRVSVNEGKHVKGRVKKYFNKLREDINTKTNELLAEITALR